MTVQTICLLLQNQLHIMIENQIFTAVLGQLMAVQDLILLTK